MPQFSPWAWKRSLCYGGEWIHFEDPYPNFLAYAHPVFILLVRTWYTRVWNKLVVRQHRNLKWWFLHPRNSLIEMLVAWKTCQYHEIQHNTTYIIWEEFWGAMMSSCLYSMTSSIRYSKMMLQILTLVSPSKGTFKTNVCEFPAVLSLACPNKGMRLVGTPWDDGCNPTNTSWR